MAGPAIRITDAAAIFVSLIGSMVLVGWAFNNDFLKSVVPGFVSMKSNTALCFLLAGAALWWSPVTRRPRATLAAAAVLVTISGLTLVEYATGATFGLDELLFDEVPGAVRTTIPNRMAVNTAVCFALLGVTLVMMRYRGRWARHGSRLLVGLGLTATLLSMTGYLFGIVALQAGSFYTTMALNTSVAMFVLVVGVLWARPDIGLASLLSRRDGGGLLARRLLPVITGLPMLLGWLVTQGVDRKYFDPPFGRSLLVVGIVVIFGIAVLTAASSLSDSEIGRLRAEAEASTDAMSGLLNRRAIDLRFALVQPGDAVVLIDFDGFKQVNDVHGHAAGDDLLRDFGRCMTTTFRDRDDWCGRLGGDEFIVVLHDTTTEGGQRAIERLRQHWLNGDPLTSFSAGLAVHLSNAEHRQTLAQADEALYAAKARNHHLVTTTPPAAAPPERRPRHEATAQLLASGRPQRHDTVH